MKIAAFRAMCPYEIGDKIRTRQNGREEVHTITDIICTHYLKSNIVEFLFELDGSGKIVHFNLPPAFADQTNDPPAAAQEAEVVSEDHPDPLPPGFVDFIKGRFGK